ncbi:hypothetical protein BGZ46_007045 [Entomortierella lignicola]|nr:hypothetical protein BGZ46_007045 [Entomortierella lignicola]
MPQSSVNRALALIDYFLLISIPIPQRRNSLVSRLKPGIKKQSYPDLSVFNTTPLSTIETLPSGNAHQTVPQQHSEKVTQTKGPIAIQFSPIPIVVGTISPHQKFKWPIPNYLEVADRPTFVRDRFEEEMIKHLSNLESLIIEDEEEDGAVDVNNFVQASRKSNSSSDESDNDDHGNDVNHMQSRVPARFRLHNRALAHSNGALLVSGLGTPPPSPPQQPMSVMDDVKSMHSLIAEPSFAQVSRSKFGGPRSVGLGRDLLVSIHQNKTQHYC